MKQLNPAYLVISSLCSTIDYLNRLSAAQSQELLSQSAALRNLLASLRGFRLRPCYAKAPELRAAIERGEAIGRNRARALIEALRTTMSAGRDLELAFGGDAHEISQATFDYGNPLEYDNLAAFCREADEMATRIATMMDLSIADLEETKNRLCAKTAERDHLHSYQAAHKSCLRSGDREFDAAMDEVARAANRSSYLARQSVRYSIEAAESKLEAGFVALASCGRLTVEIVPISIW